MGPRPHLGLVLVPVMSGLYDLTLDSRKHLPESLQGSLRGLVGFVETEQFAGGCYGAFSPVETYGKSYLHIVVVVRVEVTLQSPRALETATDHMPVLRLGARTPSLFLFISRFYSNVGRVEMLPLRPMAFALLAGAVPGG